MYLPVYLLSIVVLLLLLLLLSFRLSIELIAKDTGITYTIKGIIFKVIKVFEIKSGREGDKKEKKRKLWSLDKKERGIRDKLIGMVKEAVEDRKAKIFHIEKLSLDGTFSIEDAAANAILYGLFLILWQFLLIFLAANFRLEHQNYNFLPDFRNDRNELIFHVIFRVVIIKMVLLILHILLDTKKKKSCKSE